MKLARLRPAWLTRTEDGCLLRDPCRTRPPQAVGIQFLCPICMGANGDNPVGVPNVLCYGTKPETWLLGGTTESLTLKWGSMDGSAVVRGCDHGFRVVAGEVLVGG